MRFQRADRKRFPKEMEEVTLTASLERLGKITGLNAKELKDTFGNGDVTIGLRAGGETASDAAASFDLPKHMRHHPHRSF